ncbi:class I SAM-dependent methyltransferase [Roseibacterium sp. SDUM158017]|uniref:class I SAM-dependent methyltransferase n=1 Tax=Roseicyclus salinarum TaxID=3036773 RepID=UPI0024155728|nr:class I SAM-dependent methyltransferase [Roseibacterium sp. SDUM158017]MDG4649029.1 class I SAM-dependent methyltransferase [Roseibacterium sp. SDUM158017]
MTGGKPHWDAVYAVRDEQALTWFEATPEVSLRLVTRFAAPEQEVIDVGGGASRLVDGLLARGYGRATVLDVSGEALAISRKRLAEAADRVRWIEADVTRWQPDRAYALWHDRAVFHFLTDPGARADYLSRMKQALETGGHAILATFAEDGPETCSGLPVARYSPEALSLEIADRLPFLPVASERHVHVTPMGREQKFQVSVFRRL